MATSTAVQQLAARVSAPAELKGRVAARAAPVAAKRVVVASVEADAISRRAACGMVAGVASVLAAKPALAAYGDAANVFGGEATNKSGFLPYAGDGYAILIPSKFNVSKEREFPGMNMRYEDNFDAVNTLMVLINPGKNKMEEYGTPEAYLPNLAPLLGQQSWEGQSESEGGFKPGKVSVANVLTVGSRVTNGRTYYTYEILTRTADGDEGGRHHLFAVTCANGKLYTAKAQAGDKRWFKGLEREEKAAINSFEVA